MELRSDDIRELLTDENYTHNTSVFKGGNTDEDPDFVYVETDLSDEDVADENVDPQLEIEPIRAKETAFVSLSFGRVKTAQARFWRECTFVEYPRTRAKRCPLPRNLVIHLPGAKGQAKNGSNTVLA